MTDTVRITQAHAAQMRYDIVRMIENVSSGHPGGCLSCTDILACLYFAVLNIQPSQPDWQQRDRCILSKGHAAPALYSALSRRGYFPPAELRKLRQIGSILQGHPDCLVTPGVDMTTGCLGQGLSAGIGMTLAGRCDGNDYVTFVILGDGEMNEGQVWEAAQTAAHYGLDRLVAILDLNNLQFDGRLDQVIKPFDLAEKWRAFGWAVSRIDGHDHGQILDALNAAKQASGQPSMIVADTVKGKGVDIMENECKWHSAVDIQQMRDCLPELAKELRRHADILDAPDVW